MWGGTIESKNVKLRKIFFFKQKTAYEIVDCDWSSDVCSSDLRDVVTRRHQRVLGESFSQQVHESVTAFGCENLHGDRKSVV